MIIITLIIIALVLWLIYHLWRKSIREVDSRGYERDGYGDLIHRRVAYRNVYNYPNVHAYRFGDYDVHHKDGNKRNNSPDNLQILTREEHKEEHQRNYEEEYQRNYEEKHQKAHEEKRSDIVTTNKIEKKSKKNKEKDHNCGDCGREINHKGYCFPCNIERKKKREEK